MTSLSQAKIDGAHMEPFRVDLESLHRCAGHREAEDAEGIYERIYRESRQRADKDILPAGQTFDTAR